MTLFDVYECSSNPDLLDRRIHEAESLIKGQHYFVVSNEDFRAHQKLERFGFIADDALGIQKAPQSKALEEALTSAKVECDAQTESAPHSADPFNQEILEAVKRWFYHDWRRIENKLRTSIVEGISVFLSLFDDDPLVKRTFCPSSTLTRNSPENLKTWRESLSNTTRSSVSCSPPSAS